MPNLAVEDREPRFCIVSCPTGAPNVGIPLVEAPAAGRPIVQVARPSVGLVARPSVRLVGLVRFVRHACAGRALSGFAFVDS